MVLLGTVCSIMWYYLALLVTQQCAFWITLTSGFFGFFFIIIALLELKSAIFLQTLIAKKIKILFAMLNSNYIDTTLYY